jgi:glycosyltransferase involved in cell wall biosynthesis
MPQSGPSQKELNSICMLSVHGYVDPIPVLGRTDTGGQVVHVLELAKHLAQEDITVDIYTRRFGGRPTVAYVTPEVRIIRIPCGGKKFIPKELLFEHLGEFTNNMEDYIEREGLKYQVILSHYWDAGVVGRELAKRLSLPFFHTSHSLGVLKRNMMTSGKPARGAEISELEEKYRFKLRIREERKIFEATNGIIATSPIEKKHYQNYYNINPRKIKIIPLGVDTSWFRPRDKSRARSALKLPDNVLFSLSRIDPRKGLDLFLRAAQRVAREEDIFIIIGGGSKLPDKSEFEEKARLRRLIKELHLGEITMFTGYLSDGVVPWFYGAAEIFIVPSRYEPFGLTILESMACKTPVIATKFGGPPYLIRDGVNGFLVDPEDTDEFADTILKVLRDKNIDAVTDRALEELQKKYSWEAIVNEYIKYFSRFIK